MTWGAINELTTLTGYRRLAAVAGHPVLSDLLDRIVLDESRHFFFYYRQAEIRLERPARGAGRRGCSWTASGRRWAAACSRREELRFLGALSLRRRGRPRGRAQGRRHDPAPAGVRRPSACSKPGWIDSSRSSPALEWRTAWRPRPLSTTAPTRPKPFTRAERESTTILFGGLHWRLERVLQAVLENGGYRAQVLPVGHARGSAHRPRGRRHRPVLPDELHDRQPRQLPARRSRARSARPRWSKKYVYLTAGACGACRFGQYHQSYELALRNSASTPSACSCSRRTRWTRAADGRRPRPRPAADARRAVGDLLHRPRCRTSSTRCARTRWCRARPTRVVRESVELSLRGLPRPAAARRPWRVGRLAPRRPRYFTQRAARGHAQVRRDRGRPAAREADR